MRLEDPFSLFLCYAIAHVSNQVDPVEAGKKGGHSSGGSSEGSDDSGSGSKGQFAGGKVDPVEAGRKGGKS